MNAQRFFQFNLYRPQIQQGCTRQRINQQVQVTTLSVFGARYRSKNTQVFGAVTQGNTPDQIPVFSKNLGGPATHDLFLERRDGIAADGIKTMTGVRCLESQASRSIWLLLRKLLLNTSNYWEQIGTNLC